MATEPFKTTWKKAKDKLSMESLESSLNGFPIAKSQRLSGGTSSVFIARSLAQNPILYLMDEPFGRSRHGYRQPPFLNYCRMTAAEKTVS